MNSVITKGFSSLEDEVVLDALPIRGNIPPWLSGTLLRVGPAKFEVGETTYRHWFDGLSMLHRFSFRSNRVAYRNKFLCSRAFKAASRSGAIMYAEFATDPCRSLFRRVTSLFVPVFTDNANVNIGRFADKFIAMTETPLPIIFDPGTLETLGVFNYQDRLRGHLTTAHPHYDSARNEVFNYLTRFSYTSTYTIYRMEQDAARRKAVATIATDRPGYMHSFGMTARYIVLSEFPFFVRPVDLLISGKPFIENFSWQPDRPARFFVVDKHSGKLVGVYDTEPFFAFHHVNAFEEKGEIVLDLVSYPDTSIIEHLYLDVLRTSSPPVAGTLRRYRIHLTKGTVTSQELGDATIELPRIHYQLHNTKPYRFVYGVGSTRTGNFLDEIVKIDLYKGTSLRWRENRSYPGEPVFVPQPGTAQEDAGVIISIVLSGATQRSSLLILDARSLTEVGRAEIPHHIPFGFHGQYIPAL
ncbi:MAG: carotenoid oxygenase family protein [bacterium]|nr:carotenoid oxygenase family protein [bacterium]MDZ4295912.1 carotenoid oxygenase family protein [Patescibacteria group bacterium]